MVRNAELIDKAVKDISYIKGLEVEQVVASFKHYYDSILLHSKDIIDAIDTYNYCKRKGLEDKLEEFRAARVGNIIFINDRLGFKFNNSAIYNWYVFTDGKEVYIKVDNDVSDVPSMIKKAYYSYSEGFVIAPIITDADKGQHISHNSNCPLSALREFSDKLPIFINNFFKKTENLAQ